jgi:ABC-type transport system involved in multi-copper enzyme maturation permease subunit
MGPLQEVLLVAGRELRKSFRSAKGVILAALSVTGGGGLSMLFAWIDRLRIEHLPPSVDIGAVQEELYTRVYDADTARALVNVPYALWMMLMATLGAVPLLVALLGFDGVSAEVSARTVRFWIVRSRRASYIVGKFVGLWVAVLAVTFGMNVIVWGAVAHVGPYPIERVVVSGLRLYAVVLPISAAWCGIATLVGSQFRAPMLALLSICAATFGLWVLRVVAGFKKIDALAYVYPNAYDRLLVSPRANDIAMGLAGLLLITAASATAAAWAFEKRDL